MGIHPLLGKTPKPSHSGFGHLVSPAVELSKVRVVEYNIKNPAFLSSGRLANKTVFAFHLATYPKAWAGQGPSRELIGDWEVKQKGGDSHLFRRWHPNGPFLHPILRPGSKIHV